MQDAFRNAADENLLVAAFLSREEGNLGLGEGELFGEESDESVVSLAFFGDGVQAHFECIVFPAGDGIFCGFRNDFDREDDTVCGLLHGGDYKALATKAEWGGSV